MKDGKTLEASMLEELKEETKILLPKETLKACIKERQRFDAPDRSLRGRTITEAFLIVLPENLEKGLPKVKADDDADKAFWMPIADLNQKEDQFFEDHGDIIRYFTSKL